MAEPVTLTRRRLVLLAIAVASFAALGTSASPPPLPTLSRNLQAAVRLSADQPSVSIVYEVAASAALRAIPSSTTLRVQRTNPAGGPGSASPVALVVEPLDEDAVAATVGPWPFFSEFLDDQCLPAADCVGRFRVTAILTDPSAIDEPIDVTWSAGAATTTGKQGAPATAPVGGTLTLTADEPVVGARDRVDSVALPMEERRLDASNPGFVRTITFKRSEGAGRPGGPIAAAMLRFSATPDDPAKRPFPLELRVEDADGRTVSAGNEAGTNGVNLEPCETAGGCQTELRVIGEWLGGTADDGVTLDWSMAAFATDGTGGDDVTEPGTVGLRAGPTADLVPVPVGSADGEFDITGRFGSRRNVIVDIDPGLVGTIGDGRVQVQATLTAETTSKSGSTAPVRLIMAGASDTSAPGDAKAIVSRLLQIRCNSGSCRVAFVIEGSATQAPEGDVHVVWHLSTALVARPPATIPRGTHVTITVSEAPP